jgi:hypothetical protein
VGICLPPRAIYLLPERMDDGRLRAHEGAHWRQYERRGVLRYYAGYVALWVRYVYVNHPWEVEARNNEHSA